MSAAEQWPRTPQDRPESGRASISLAIAGLALTTASALAWQTDRYELSFPLLALSAIALATAWIAERRAVAATRKAMLSAVIERRLLLESIEVTPTPFALYNADDVLIAWNSSYQQLHDPAFSQVARPIRYEDLMRSVARQLLPAAEVEKSVAQRVAVQRAADGQAIDREYPGGRWLRVTKVRTQSGAIAGFAADVTELKNREAELVASEARLKDFADIASDWFWEATRDERIVFVSARLGDLGFDPHDWLGKTHREIAVGAEGGEAMWAEHAAPIAKAEPFRDLTFEAATRDGTLRYIALSGKPVFDDKDGLVGYRGVGRDVTETVTADLTERKQTEGALREARMELAHVNRVTTMGQLAASIAHEVNQPIAATVAHADAGLLWLDASPPDLEEVRLALEGVIKAGNRAGDVIGRIRALIKKTPPRKDPLDINEMLLEVVALTRSELLRNRVSLQTQLRKGLPLCHGDRVQLQQAVLNLILNAVEAMTGVNDGSRELLISTEKDLSGGVIVAVQDTGPGLDAAHLARLFDAFYTTKPGGMGMGLSICRSIIEAHGGRLWATSNIPHGAIFQFSLPAKAENAS
jgi:PAS domain S-box-containing protein